MKLRAFNLIPGLVIADPDSPRDLLVIMSVVRRNADNENITVAARNKIKESRFDFDYNAQVDLLGVAVNPFDWEDEDFGTSAVFVGGQGEAAHRVNQDEPWSDLYEEFTDYLNKQYGEINSSINMSIAAVLVKKTRDKAQEL